MPYSHLQARAARSLLGLDQAFVAKNVGIIQSAFSKYENEGKGVGGEKLSALKKFYINRGIEFIGMRGVAMREDRNIIYEGVEGFRLFMDDVYETAKAFGGDICLFNSKPRLWYDYLGKEWYDMHAKRMADLGDKIRVRITVQQGEDFFILGTALHKWFPKLNWKEKIVYVYGPKLAFLDFSGEDIRITVMNSEDFAESFRVLFDIAWDSVAVSPPKAE